MTTSCVQVELEENVAIVKFSAPKQRNALSRSLLRELRDALTGQQVALCNAVVLAGDGDTFSAGADLRELTGGLKDRMLGKEISSLVDLIRHLPVPVIAAIEGACIGAGVDLLLACDIAVASESAFFQVPAVRLGLLYSPSSVARWQRSLGRSTVRRLLLLGERFDAEAALQEGLIARIVPRGSARQLSVRLGTGAVRGEATAAMKRMLADLEDDTFDRDDWEVAQEKMLGSPERRRSVAEVKRRMHVSQRHSEKVR